MQTTTSLLQLSRQRVSGSIRSKTPACLYARCHSTLRPSGLSGRLRTSTTTRPCLAELQPIRQPATHTILRYLTTTTRTAQSTAPSSTSSALEAQSSQSQGIPLDETPRYELTFTCKPCSTRSSHRVSKQGYHKGTVLITCPECKNRHVISDHLKIFEDRPFNIEDLMRRKGEIVRRGVLKEGVAGEETGGDVELWDDGTVVQRGVGDAGQDRMEKISDSA